MSNFKRVIYGSSRDSYFLCFSKVVKACVGLKPDGVYKLLLYACAEASSRYCEVNLNVAFRERFLKESGMSYLTYEKCRKALMNANILKQVYVNGKKVRGCYKINEAVAFKGDLSLRKQLFSEGLVAKITVEAVDPREVPEADLQNLNYSE